MNVKSLEDMAAFNIANVLWKKRINNNELHELSTDDIHQILGILKNLSYNLPQIIIQKIVAAINTIGSGLFEMNKNIQRMNASFQEFHLTYEDIYWKYNFTPDVVKSFCQTKQFTVANEVFCQCCLDHYVLNIEGLLENSELEDINLYFGLYRYHALAYYICHVRKGYHIGWFVALFQRFFVQNMFIENMFKFCALLGYIEAASQHLIQLMPSNRTENVRCMLQSFISEDSFNCVKWNNSDMFLYLWRQLNISEQSKIVDNHYLELYRYMIFNKMDPVLPLLKKQSYIIQKYAKSHSYWVLLDYLIHRMNTKKSKMFSDSYYRTLILILWNNIGTSLPDSIIINFLKCSCILINEPELIHTLINIFDNEKKSVLNKEQRISSYLKQQNAHYK